MRLELGCLCKAEITEVKNLFGREWNSCWFFAKKSYGSLLRMKASDGVMRVGTRP